MTSRFSAFILALFGALSLAACQTMPQSGFTRAQTEMLQSQGFVETEQGWQLSMADRMLFATNSSDVQPEMAGRIATMAQGLQSVGLTSARVEGHTDSSGSEEYNARLSEARANAVAVIMQANGFPAAGLAIRGWGESLPIADNATEEGMAQNRRVVVIVTAL
ncbi:OmpA family protein [Sphingomonas lacunae]|uniref:OmpA family protein n=1 Tax=Sphingomonas lacunae TaxID=2698828 RepID=A0A6M4AYF1_9SPHN|nr:OmpA family protein [Sphingomonas lacunae]QJQ33402.1 OmpA family protein [Sphingomonas lacunae]